MDFIGGSLIDVKNYYVRMKSIEQRIVLRKKWCNISHNLLKTVQKIVLLASKERSTIIKDRILQFRDYKLHYYLVKWENRQKWKKFIRLILNLYRKAILNAYFNKYCVKKNNVYRNKWRNISKKLVEREKMHQKARSYRELLQHRNLDSYFDDWKKIRAVRSSEYYKTWVSFSKRIRKIKFNKGIEKHKKHFDLLMTWNTFSSRLTTINKQNELEDNAYKFNCRRKWLKFTRKMMNKEAKTKIHKITYTKPTWISMIKRITRIKQRKLLQSMQKENKMRGEWTKFYERIVSKNKTRIIKEGKAKIQKIKEENNNKKLIKESFTMWVKRYNRKTTTRTIMKGMFRDALIDYRTSNRNQCALMIQNLFIGKLLVRERFVWKRRIEPLFYKWKQSQILKQMFDNSIPDMIEVIEYPTYDIEFEDIRPDIGNVSPAFDTIGVLCDNFLVKERKKEDERREKEADEIATKALAKIDLDSILTGMCKVSVSQTMKPKPKIEKQIPGDIFNPILDKILEDSFNSLPTKINIQPLNVFGSKTLSNEEKEAQKIEEEVTKLVEKDLDNILSGICCCNLSPINNFNNRKEQRENKNKKMIINMCEKIIDINMILDIKVTPHINDFVLPKAIK